MSGYKKYYLIDDKYVRSVNIDEIILADGTLPTILEFMKRYYVHVVPSSDQYHQAKLIWLSPSVVELEGENTIG